MLDIESFTYLNVLLESPMAPTVVLVPIEAPHWSVARQMSLVPMECLSIP